jgi:AcrR family transcriptional regulator
MNAPDLSVARDSQAATRAALLDAAEELILESSMPGLSLRAVCTRAGFTQGAFYSSFASRELLLAVMERNLEERVRTFGEMTLDYHAMTLDQTIAQIGEWLATVSDRREWAQMAIELRLEAVRNPALPAP